MDGKRHTRPFKARRTDYNVNFPVNSIEANLSVNFAENSIDSSLVLSCSRHSLDASTLEQVHTSVKNPKGAQA